MKGNKLLILVLIALGIVSIVILINFLSFSNIQVFLIRQIQESQLSQTQSSGNQIGSYLLDIKDELVTFTKFPTIDGLSSDKCRPGTIHNRVSSKIDGLLRVDKYGDVIECSSPTFSHYFGLNIKNKDYYYIPEFTNEPHISTIIGQEIIVSAPLFKTTEYTPYPNFLGEFQGVLLSIVKLSDLYNKFIHPNLDPGINFFFLINLKDNSTILQSNDLPQYSEIKSLTHSSTNQIININNFGESIVTSSDILVDENKWGLLFVTPLNNVGKEIQSVQVRNLFSLVFIILVITTIFVFLISLYKSKQQVQSELAKVNVTLEKLGINVDTETEKFSQADINLDTGKIYLVKEDDENQAHELFIGSLNRGFAGLGILRENPKSFMKRYNLEKTSFIWLTNSKVEDIACETRVENIFNLISEFINKSSKSVILIERLDYIISENKFEKVINKLFSLRDTVQGRECIVILSINQDLIDSSSLKVIEAETVDLFGKHLRNRVELQEIEMNILVLINDANIKNILVSYKDVTTKFKITKPTTRVKINKLLGLGLIQVEPKGRFKSLKITSAGRRIIG